MIYNYAIIGCGAITRRGHLPAIKKIKEINAVAVSDINIKNARKVAKEFHIPKYYKDYREMLKKENIDVVIVATPTPTHFNIALDTIREGIHTIIEKPLSIHLNEAIKIVDASVENKVKVSVVQNYRYFPAALIAKRNIEENRLGKILSIIGCAHSTFPTTWTKGTWLYHEGGVLYDYFPHLVDLTLWLLEFRKIKEVYATGGDALNDGFVNFSHVVINFEDGMYASLETSWLVGTMLLEIIIRGTGGWTYLDVRWDHVSEWHGVPTPIDYTRDYMKRMIRVASYLFNKKFFTLPLLMLENFHRDFISMLNGKGGRNVATARQAAYVTGILELALKSIKSKQVQKFPDELNDLLVK